MTSTAISSPTGPVAARSAGLWLGAVALCAPVAQFVPSSQRARGGQIRRHEWSCAATCGVQHGDCQCRAVDCIGGRYWHGCRYSGALSGPAGSKEGAVKAEGLGRDASQVLSGLPNANAKSQRFSYAISQIAPLPPVVALNRSFKSQIAARYAAFWHAVSQIALTSFL